MIQLNSVLIEEDVETIITELRTQLHINGIDRFSKIIISGNNLQTNCPFHGNGQERKPSFGILLHDAHGRKAGTGHCFACGWAGSLSEMISNCFGYEDFGKYGEKWLIKNFLSVQIESRAEIEIDVTRDNRSSVHDLCGCNYVTEEELDSYRYAHPYMYQRGLTDNLIDYFDIGFDISTNSVTFPIRDKSGNCLIVAKRNVQTKYFSLPVNQQKPLYGLYELYNLKEFPKQVYVCEGPFDALSMWRVGKFAVALLGLGNELQIKQLNQLPCREIIFALDNDNAGQTAIQRLAKRIPRKILKRVEYPQDKKDAGECTGDELLSLNEIFL